jgi:hypothetical protein
MDLAGGDTTLEELMRHRTWVRTLAATLVRDPAVVDESSRTPGSPPCAREDGARWEEQ